MIAPIWLDVLDETARLSAAHGRTDLVESVQQKRTQLLDPRLRVLVLGEPGQGKSQLINGLLNAPACPVGDELTTVLPTVVTHADTPTVALVHTPPAGNRPGGAITEPDRTPLPLDQVAAAVAGKLGGHPGAAHVEIGLPRALLGSGMVLIDTPGLDALDPTQLDALTAFARADIVLVASDVNSELSPSEISTIGHLAQSHARVALVLTKIDLSPRWRDAAEQSRRRLAAIGVRPAVLPVSADLRLRAAGSNDSAVNAESGFPALLARLNTDRAAKTGELARAAVGQLTRTVIEQLAAPLRTEPAEARPEPAPGPLSRLHEAQRTVDELRRCSVRWQHTLNDEMADLLSDLEYDLRDRTRKILRKVDEVFDKADPLSDWDTFAQWLDENLLEADEANHGWMLQRFDVISRRVAEHFLAYGHGDDTAPGWSPASREHLTENVPLMEQPYVERFTYVQKFFTGLRGSYGGILIFGLATSLAGMPLINPVSLGAGALFGAKTVLDESRGLLKRRQATVKAAAQRHVDDFFLLVSKDCRDMVRQLQRLLRDHYTALTEQLQQQIVESLRRAKLAADADVAERDQQMRQLAVLQEQARRLAAAPAGARA
ncbi:dynamin family protein [Catellatospora chokoriensis]|uniref:Isoniazid inducible gene protein IniA n=1 Tax=Catellatospora chokoriensis TaxID=310353 RepID=A0A8J3JW17_9ACTN|nr:dynamin family protein [Catellatospora chokoriensis]GIF89534.1 isoniazid inducible gene protein IniA [Catellatospora chokoriensis]